jgi:hypothetical protein
MVNTVHTRTQFVAMPTWLHMVCTRLSGGGLGYMDGRCVLLGDALLSIPSTDAPPLYTDPDHWAAVFLRAGVECVRGNACTVVCMDERFEKLYDVVTSLGVRIEALETAVEGLRKIADGLVEVVGVLLSAAERGVK